MSIDVHDMRMSLVWFESDPELLGEQAPVGSLAFLRDQKAYWDRFERVQKYGEDPDGLIPPWPSHRGKHFWSLYLGQAPHDLKAWHAWDRSVPFRRKFPVEITAEVPARITVEGFFYPYGRGVLVAARLGAHDDGRPWSLDEVVQWAHAIRSESQLEVTWPGLSPRRLKVETLANVVLEQMRQSARGVGRSASGATGPFSVATFLEVNGADPSATVPAGEDLHRALMAITSWPALSTWKFAKLPASLDDALSDVDEVPGHLHLTDRNGRVSWLPALPRRKLGCLHRNQALAALQVEALGSFVRTTRGRLGRGLLPADHESLARKAAGLLGRIYGGDPSTYKSLACKAQLDERGYAEDLDAVRREFGMLPLH